jgi:hypothetical protein
MPRCGLDRNQCLTFFAANYAALIVLLRNHGKTLMRYGAQANKRERYHDTGKLHKQFIPQP